MAYMPTVRKPTGGVGIPTGTAPPTTPTTPPVTPAPGVNLQQGGPHGPYSDALATGGTGRPSAGKGGGAKGSGTAATPGGNYGYSTKDKTAFNPFAMPKTVGALNAQALALARPGYQPQLQQSAADRSAENLASQQRATALKGIYGEYGNQAQAAFNETQQALKDMIASNATGDTQQAGVLSAALNSAIGGSNQLGAMMGQSGVVTPGEVAPYTAAAQGAAAGTGQELKALSGGLLSTTGETVANASLEGAQQRDIESTRHQAALQANTQSRDAIVAGIPDVIAKVRQQLITDLLNSQGLQFQQTLADKQFGLAQQTEKANAAIAKGTLTLNQVNAAAQRANATTQLQQNQQTIDNNRLAIEATAKRAQAVLSQAVAKAQGTRQANGIKYLAAWVQPLKQELVTTSKLNPDGSTTHGTKLADPSAWHRNPMDAFNQLTRTYGFTPAEAYQLMAGFNTPIGRGAGITIAQWAEAHLKALTPQTTAGGINSRSAGSIMKVVAGLFR